MSTKKALLGIAAAAVIAIGYFAVSGFPPVGPGAEGTVGAAKRYQSEQMASKDVVLQDTGVQQLLQSDTLRKLIADKETRAILVSEDFKKAMSDASVQALVQQMAADRALAAAVGSAAHDGAVQRLFAEAASNEAVRSALGQALDNAAVAKAFDQAATQAAAAELARSQAAGRGRSGTRSPRSCRSS